MARDTQYVLARSKGNGGLYTMGISVIRKYPDRWEVVNEDDVEPEMDYFELKTKLSDLGVDFKGNAKKDELLKLYEEAVK